MFASIWKSDEKLLIFSLLILFLKSFCVEANIYQAFKADTFSDFFVKNTPLPVVFSTLYSVFHTVVKQCVSYLIYYFRH